MATVGRDLAPGEWSVLALLSDVPAHGWAIAKAMSRNGEIGGVWAVGRPLVYRAIDLLQSRGLIEAVGSERGSRGPNRALFKATPDGREALARWLAEPVDHVRDIRSLLLLKLVLIERAGLDNRPLLESQLALTLPAIAALEARLRRSVGTESVFVRFRLETTRAVAHFIEGMLVEPRAEPQGQRAGSGS
ncbi:MAG TPA: PadR family transcriptional regulator [Gaiellaceae bacterium]|nr:PadR family transcriptional regulator [Gaiellaceae bacterium]